MLCVIALYCVLLWCVTLCDAWLCVVVFGCAVFYCVVLGCAVLCFVVRRGFVMRCCVMLHVAVMYCVICFHTRVTYTLLYALFHTHTINVLWTLQYCLNLFGAILSYYEEDVRELIYRVTKNTTQPQQNTTRHNSTP